MALLPTRAFAQQVGVVLMHGKWGAPQGPTQSLELAMRGAGIHVIAREMAWSGRRAYDESLDQVMGEIDKEVAELKSGGAQRIVVGGQSFGANMALAYGARHPELDGVLAISPGHTPERFMHIPEMAKSLDKARSLIAAGKGEQVANFDDINQGRSRQVSAKPSIYLSFFDPGGDAVMSVSAARLSPHTALLIVVGTHDPMYEAGPGAIFDHAPKNPHSAYKVVESDHFGAPDAARPIVLDWIKGLH